jgi:hypothetical protein
MKIQILILSAAIMLFTTKANAETICDSIGIDTVFVESNFLHITVYNSSQHFIAYPFFTAVLSSNPYITIIDTLAIPTFLSIPGDGNDGYTTATYTNVSIAPAGTVPQNTLFTGTLSIQDPNDPAFLCIKPFDFLYGEMVTSVSAPHNEILKLYPNPSDGQFKVVLATENAVLTVTDQTGRELIKKEINQKTTNIELEKPGIYILQIKSGQGITTRKLVVKHE